MIVDRFVADLDARLNKLIIEEALKMANGQCKNMEEYDHKVGLIRGLRRASDEAKALAKDSSRDQDEEDSIALDAAPAPWRRT